MVDHKANYVVANSRNDWVFLLKLARSSDKFTFSYPPCFRWRTPYLTWEIPGILCVSEKTRKSRRFYTSESLLGKIDVKDNYRNTSRNMHSRIMNFQEPNQLKPYRWKRISSCRFLGSCWLIFILKGMSGNLFTSTNPALKPLTCATLDDMHLQDALKSHVEKSFFDRLIFQFRSKKYITDFCTQNLQWHYLLIVFDNFATQKSLKDSVFKNSR